MADRGLCLVIHVGNQWRVSRVVGPLDRRPDLGKSTQPVITRDQLIVHMPHNRSAPPIPSGGRGGGIQRTPFRGSGQRMNEPNTKPNATAMAMLISPGTMKGWLNTALPIWVVPVSSICTAARRVG